MPNKQPAAPDRGFVVWLTGLSGAGKTSLSLPLAERLRGAGHRVEVLDGDEVRTHLTKGLGFSKEDRDVNVRRIGFVAALLAKHGVAVITAAISPYAEVRVEVRGRVTGHGADFVEVFVDCPIAVLAERDVKGLYKQALAGQIPHFTGVSDPYERPTAPEVTVDSSTEAVAESLAKIVAELGRRGLIAP